MLRPALIASLLALAALMAPASPRAHAELPSDVTLQGTAGGGTVTLTLTEDRTGVRRVGLEDVTYQPAAQGGCGATISAVRHFDPPGPVNSSSGFFSVSLIAVGSGVLAIDKASVIGQLSGDTIVGSTGFSASTGEPEVGCMSEALPYTASGPVETPPAATDLRYQGTVKGHSGKIEVHLAPGGGVTSIGLLGVTGPCVATNNPVDGREFHDPPLAQASGTGAFTGGFFLSGADLTFIRTATVSGEQPGPGALSGTLQFETFSPSCSGSADWNAVLITAVGGVARPPDVPPVSGGGSWWGPALALSLALTMVALALARLRRRLS